MTYNQIHRLQTNLHHPGPPHPQPAAPSTPATGSGVSAMDPAALRNAAKSAPEVEAQIRSGCKAFPHDTDAAAAALGAGWATAAKMKQTSAEWLQALRRLESEIEYLGAAVTKSADNRQWAETESQQRIMQIRKGG